MINIKTTPSLNIYIYILEHAGDEEGPDRTDTLLLYIIIIINREKSSY